MVAGVVWMFRFRSLHGRGSGHSWNYRAMWSSRRGQDPVAPSAIPLCPATPWVGWLGQRRGLHMHGEFLSGEKIAADEQSLREEASRNGAEFSGKHLCGKSHWGGESTNNQFVAICLFNINPKEPLLACVINRIPRLMQQHGIGLIIIDSVAAIFRLYNDYLERARHMRRLADALLSYADKYNCAVVCVNQVATRDGQDEIPCLGLQWAHLGRTRLRVSRVPKQHRMGDQLITVRKLEILYSPETPNDFAEFLITAEGVVNVPEPSVPSPPAKMRRLWLIEFILFILLSFNLLNLKCVTAERSISHTIVLYSC